MNLTVYSHSVKITGGAQPIARRLSDKEITLHARKLVYISWVLPDMTRYNAYRQIRSTLREINDFFKNSIDID